MLLLQMGMRKMFSDEADFSGISECRLKVSKVIQKAFIQVNEEGSEAAAATRESLEPLLHVFQLLLKNTKTQIFSLFLKDIAF